MLADKKIIDVLRKLLDRTGKRQVSSIAAFALSFWILGLCFYWARSYLNASKVDDLLSTIEIVSIVTLLFLLVYWGIVRKHTLGLLGLFAFCFFFSLRPILRQIKILREERKEVSSTNLTGNTEIKIPEQKITPSMPDLREGHVRNTSAKRPDLQYSSTILLPQKFLRRKDSAKYFIDGKQLTDFEKTYMGINFKISNGTHEIKVVVDQDTCVASIRTFSKNNLMIDSFVNCK